MAVSMMSAELFVHAFETGDFTGWREWTAMDDESYSTMLMLSATGRFNRYSILARSDDPNVKSSVMFILCIDQVDDRLSHLSNKIAIRNAKITGEDMQRLVIEIDHGEHIILDMIDRPAIKTTDLGSPLDPEDDGEGDGDPCDRDDDESYDDTEEPRTRENRRILSKLRSDNTQRARSNMPPKDRTGFRKYLP